MEYDNFTPQATGMLTTDGLDVERTITFTTPFIASAVYVHVSASDSSNQQDIHFRYDLNVEYIECIPSEYTITPDEGDLTFDSDTNTFSPITTAEMAVATF